MGVRLNPDTKSPTLHRLTPPDTPLLEHLITDINRLKPFKTFLFGQLSLEKRT